MTDKPFYEKLTNLLGELNAEIKASEGYTEQHELRHIKFMEQIKEMQAELTVRKKKLADDIMLRSSLFQTDYRKLEERVLAEIITRYGLVPHVGVSANSRQYKLVYADTPYSGIDGRCKLHYDPMDLYAYLPPEYTGKI